MKTNEEILKEWLKKNKPKRIKVEPKKELKSLFNYYTRAKKKKMAETK